MPENYFPLTNGNFPKKEHADSYGKVAIGGKNKPWRIEDYRTADYFAKNKGYTIWTFTFEPIGSSYD